MADRPPHDPQRQPESLPRPKPPVVEREPLTVTVVEPAVAEEALQHEVQVEAPSRFELWRPSNLGVLLIAAGVLLFTLYRLQFSPLILRWEHGLERRIFGERSYEAHREPRARGVAIRPE